MQFLGPVFVAVRVLWRFVLPADAPPGSEQGSISWQSSASCILLLHLWKLLAAKWLLAESKLCFLLMPVPMAVVWLFHCVPPLLRDRALSPALSSHTFHLLPHFWMVTQVYGRKRLRGSKILLWSLRMLTNARWKRVQQGVMAWRGTGTGFCHWVDSVIESQLSFPWGSRIWGHWLWLYCMLNAFPELNKLETWGKKMKEKWKIWKYGRMGVL